MRPANLHSKIFLDGGDPREAAEILGQLGFLAGQTTNPSLIAKNPEVERRLAAIEKFTKYKTSASNDKENLEEADLLLNQCQNAKSLMASPLNVLVTNLGNDINSKYDDKNPCITADGLKLVFTI